MKQAAAEGVIDAPPTQKKKKKKKKRRVSGVIFSDSSDSPTRLHPSPDPLRLLRLRFQKNQ